MNRTLLTATGVLLITLFALGLSGNLALARSYVIVTPSSPHGWCWMTSCGADIRPGGQVNFIADSTAPGFPHRGALQLVTDATTASKAQALHAANTLLGDVSELTYYTKQISPPGPVADPAYQLIMCLNGGNFPSPSNPTAVCSGFTTLVFEPYQNPGNNGNAAVVTGIWQKWDVYAGLFWSTRTVMCSNGTVVGTPGGPATYTVQAIVALCPNANVAGLGLNVGTFNPSYNVETDLFNFNGTVYNFEPDRPQCRSHGDGDFEDKDHGHGHGNFSFNARCDRDEDAGVDSDDRGDGKDFHSSQVSSTVVDDNTRTITLTGIGTSAGLPVMFVFVATESTATTPGWVSLILSDGYAAAGDLTAGEVIFE